MQIEDRSWDDLRYLLAVKRFGSFQVAGEALGVATSTVSRRVDGLERALGTRLVERTTRGVALTTDAARLVALAEEIELRVASGSRDLGGGDARLAGRIRVTAGDGFMPFLVRAAARFRAAHPDVAIDLVADTRLLDLSRREADLGIRTVKPKSGALVARRLAELEYGLFASPEYLARAPRPRSARELAHHAFVGYEDARARHPAMRWLHEQGAARFVMRVSSDSALVEAVRAAQGIAALPVALVGDDAALVRLLPASELPRLPVWMALHRDLRRVARVRELADAIAAELSAI
jgi:DNA-binding transcriptional LysR family regulator